MTNQVADFTPTAWILLVAWVVFNLVLFMMGWLWLASLLNQGDQPYVRLQSGLNRLMIIAAVEVLWLSAILLAAGIDSQNLVCLPVIFLVVLVPVYIRNWRFYRRMIQKNRDQSSG